MEDSYIDEFSRLALAVTSGQLAKRAFAAESRSGEDLNFNFIGWKDGKVSIIVQMDKRNMLLPIEQRLNKCTSLCLALRRFWGVDGMTMIAEGWCSKDPGKTKNLDLGKEFISKNPAVTECLTILHGQINDDEEISITVMASPYEYGEDDVEFGELIFYSDGGINAVRDKKFPAMVYRCLVEEIESHVPRGALDEVAQKILDDGFHIQEFF